MALQLSGETMEVWRTAGDARVCPTCRALEGQNFPAGQGPQLPVHEGCRCSRQPGGAGGIAEGLQPRRAMPMQPVRPYMGPTPTAPSGVGTAVSQYGATTMVMPPEPSGGVIVRAGGVEQGRIIGGEWVSSAPVATAPLAGYAGPRMVAPSEPEGGVIIRQGRREVGRMVQGEFVSGAPPVAPRPVLPPGGAPLTRPPVTAAPIGERPGGSYEALADEVKQTTVSLKGWREQIGQVKETGAKFLDQLKGWVGGGPAEGGDVRSSFQAQLKREFEATRQRYAAAGWRDPYAGAAEEMAGMPEAAGPEGGGKPPAWAGQMRRAVSGMGLFYAARMGRMFWQPGEEAMAGLEKYQLGLQGGMYAAGLPMGAPAGMAGEMLQTQAQLAQQKLLLGQAAFGAWGWAAGLGAKGGELGAAATAIGGAAIGR